MSEPDSWLLPCDPSRPLAEDPRDKLRSDSGSAGRVDDDAKLPPVSLSVSGVGELRQGRDSPCEDLLVFVVSVRTELVVDEGSRRPPLADVLGAARSFTVIRGSSVAEW